MACVHTAHFPFRVELQIRDYLQGKPAIVADLSPGVRKVVDASPQARGITAGMPLPEALSRCPGAVLLEADLALYQAAFDHLLDALEMVSPLVEGEGLGLAYVDLDGLEELYGGEEAMLAALARSVVPFQADIGVGQAKFTAYLAARSSRPGRWRKAADDAGAFLRDFPVDVLPLPWQVVERLRGFGLGTLGEVSRLSPGPLQAQLGPQGRQAWELANGIDRRPFLARRSEEQVTESLALASPAVSLEPILVTAEALLARLFRHPQVTGKYVRALALEGRLSRGASFTQRVAFREPVGEAGRAHRLLKMRLVNLQLPGPLEELSITLMGLTGETGRQVNLFTEVRKRDNLREALRQLEARLGRRPPVYQVREVEPWSRIPERRRALVEYVP
ncbi:MAG: DNA polymerase Y family protein [Dehalococcoidia bacterium]|nr:DNA polymerase Y family protein [Dehalococcoidia bacterium]